MEKKIVKPKKTLTIGRGNIVHSPLKMKSCMAGLLKQGPKPRAEHLRFNHFQARVLSDV